MKKITLDQTKYDLLKNIHIILIEELISFKSDFQAINGGMIVFLKKNSNNNIEIDWDYSNKLNGFKIDLKTYLINNNNDTSKLTNKLFKLKMDKRRLLKFKMLETKLNPLSLFKKSDSTTSSFRDYFKQKYDIDTEEELNQPLVELNTIDYHRKFISKIQKLNKSGTEKEKAYRELFICEHVIILPFETSQLSMLLMIPSIFYRINCLLKLSKLKNLIENQLRMDLKINLASYIVV
jgi:hypothetical protein